MILVSALLFGSIPAVVQEPIAFEAQGERLDAVVERLAEVTGQPLVVGEEGAKHHLAIYAKSLTADELIAGIARVTVSQWIPDRETMRLVPDRAERRRMANANYQKRAEIFSQLVKDWQEWISENESGETQQAVPRGVVTTSPYMENIPAAVAHRAGSVLLDHIDPSVVARLMTGDRVAFSTQPNAKQLRFRPLPATFFRDLNRDYQAGIEEVSQSAAHVRFIDHARLRLINIGLQDYFTTPDSEKSVSKIVLTLTDAGSDYNIFNNYFIYVKGYTLEDGRHKQMFAFSIELQGEIDDDEIMALTPASLAKPDVVEFEPGVSAVLEQLTAWTRTRTRFSKAPEVVQDYLLNRVENNPRRQMYAPLYRALAEHNDIDVVAAIPDDLYSGFMSFSMEPLLMYAFLEMVGDDSVENGTLYSGLKDPDRNVFVSVDDRRLEAFLKRNSDYMSLPMREQVAYIAERGHWRVQDPTEPVIRAVFRPAGFAQNLDVLKVLSYASGTDLDAVLTEGRVRFGSLSPALRGKIETEIYNQNLAMVKHASDSLPASIFERHEAQMTNLHQYGVRIEPTELLPNGVPAEAIWDTRVFQEFGFIHAPQPGESQGWAGPIDAVRLLQTTEHDIRIGTAAAQQLPTRFFVGDLTHYEFRLLFQDGFATDMSVTDMPLGNDAVHHQIYAFPVEVQAHLERIRKLMEESGRFPTGSQQNVRPPEELELIRTIRSTQ